MVLQNPPSLVERNGRRFLIFDAPSDGTLPEYMRTFKQHGLTDVVRVCEPTYGVQPLEAVDIKVHDWGFPDGDAPPSEIINKWLNLVEERGHGCVGIHCVAGLGRAPVLVAVALIEDGMSSLEAVSLIRKHRRGAINSKQLMFLEKYKPRRRRRGDGPGACCAVM